VIQSAGFELSTRRETWTWSVDVYMRRGQKHLVSKSAGVEIDGACSCHATSFQRPDGATDPRECASLKVPDLRLSTDNRTCGSARAVPLGSPHPGEPLVPEFLNSLERGLMALANPFVESKSLP
jgi:hypothetical protein